MSRLKKLFALLIGVFFLPGCVVYNISVPSDKIDQAVDWNGGIMVVGHSNETLELLSIRKDSAGNYIGYREFFSNQSNTSKGQDIPLDVRNIKEIRLENKSMSRLKTNLTYGAIGAGMIGFGVIWMALKKEAD